MIFFVSDKLRLAYQVDGPDNAPTVVFVNSLGTDLRMWDPQIALLGDKLRIVRYDCRGHGASDVTSELYTIEELGLDLLKLLDTLQIERTHICGLSLGGMIALWFAATFPDRITSAIFANTAARIGTEETWNARIDTVRRGGMGAIRDAVLARFLSEGFRQRNPQVARHIGEMIEATNPIGYIGACAALRDADLREMVPTIHVPSLIVAGELDESTPPAQVRELHTAITGSELVEFKEVAHLSNVEKPEDFSQQMLAFLARV
jgi:3-oxoadipate enol-lactonase